MPSLSYFLALAASGAVLLLFVVGPWFTVFPQLLAGAAPGADVETLRAAGWALALGAWVALLAGLWWKHGRLAPATARAGRERRLRLGHALVGTGHGLLAAMLVFAQLRWLLFLPLLLVLGSYAIGTVLIETARPRAVGG